MAASCSDPQASPTPIGLRELFAVPALEQWRALAEKDLAGGDFDKRLVWKPLEGVAVPPLLTRADLEAIEALPGELIAARGGTAPGWQVVEEAASGPLAEAAARLVSALERGATAIALRRAGGSASGLILDTAADVDAATEGVELDAVPVHLRGQGAATGMLTALAAVAKQRGIAGERLAGTADADPLGHAVESGTLPGGVESVSREVVNAATLTRALLPAFRSITVSTAPLHEGGAGATLELAWALGVLAEYSQSLISNGFTPDEAAGFLAVELPVSEDFYREIAKLRALRVLLPGLLAPLGVTPVAAGRIPILARTSRRMMSRRDPYANMIRTSLAAYAAAVGGCDALTVLPFDALNGPSDAMARRIARNQQIILMEEAGLARVSDPAAGSYLFESLTEKLARDAWKRFQGFEAEGGIVQALVNGRLAEAVEADARQRLEGAAQRRDPIVGVSAYANPVEAPLNRPASATISRAADHATRNEEQVSRLLEEGRETSGGGEGGAGGPAGALVEAISSGATLDEIAEVLRPVPAGALRFRPVAPCRPAVPFEILRDAADALTGSRNGRRPTALLLRFGPDGMSRVRAEFCSGFLAAGGFVSEVSALCADDAAVRSAIDAANPDVVVLCSDDANYPETGAAFASAIRGANGPPVYLAGFPKEHLVALKTAGVRDCIHIRANALDTLSELHRLIGIQAPATNERN